MNDRQRGETEELIRRVRRGDPAAREILFGRHRERLLSMVRVRLDPRLSRRIDPADVVQETYLAVCRRWDEYVRGADIPFFVWLRILTGQILYDLHREHLGVQARDVRREVALGPVFAPQASSVALANQLLARCRTPSSVAARLEARSLVEQGLEQMDPLHREILVLRHFEHLTNLEAAHELGITPSAASKRHVRALAKLKGILAGIPGAQEALWPNTTN